MSNEIPKKTAKRFYTRQFNLSNVLDVITHDLITYYKELNYVNATTKDPKRILELKAIIGALSEILTA
jgi:hypothetical protein